MPRVAISPSHIQGNGLFALEDIPRGAVILPLDDSRVIDVERPLRPEFGERAIHRDFLPDGTVVLMQEPERFINHCCEPNAYVYSANRQRYVLAMRDIHAGGEILVDYSLNAVDGDDWECRCGAATCRGFHKCDFFALPPALQLANLPYLDPWFATVHSDRIGALLAR
jgi:SET domain-containing protein